MLVEDGKLTRVSRISAEREFSPDALAMVFPDIFRRAAKAQSAGTYYTCFESVDEPVPLVETFDGMGLFSGYNPRYDYEFEFSRKSSVPGEWESLPKQAKIFINEFPETLKTGAITSAKIVREANCNKYEEIDYLIKLPVSYTNLDYEQQKREQARKKRKIIRRLRSAIYDNKVPLVERLAKKVDLSGSDVLGDAARNCQPEMLRSLIASGANVDVRYRFGGAALNQAVGRWVSPPAEMRANDCKASVMILLRAGSDVSALRDYGAPLLRGASKSPEILDFLLAKGVEINSRDSRGYTAIMLMLERTHSVKRICRLIDRGADVFLKAKNGETAWSLLRKDLKSRYEARGKDIPTRFERYESILKTGSCES